MTNRDRVIASLNHKRPDKVPYSIGFTVKARAKMVEFYGDPQFESRLDDCLCAVDTAEPDGGRTLEADIWEDEFGVQWDRSIDKDIGTVCNCIITPENLKEYQFPDASNPARYERYDTTIRDNRDKFILANLGFSLFERAWTLAGMETILMSMVTNPGFVNELLDGILRYNLEIIEHACSHEIDGMLFGDDWGQQRGMLMGPGLWREFIKPRVGAMYQAVKSRGKKVFIHCCGKVDEVFPDLIDVGLDVFNPFQPEVTDVYEMKRLYGDRLSFWGGISTQKTLPSATVQEVKDEVRRLLDSIGEDGGYIAAPAHAVPGDAKPENIAAMIEVLNDQ